MIKMLIKMIRNEISENRKMVLLRKKNSTVQFYSGVKATDVEFGGKNVLFQDVVIAQSKLGRHSYIQRRTEVYSSHIGSFCSIAGGVLIGLPMHPLSFVSTHPSFFIEDSPLVEVFCKKTVKSEDDIITSIGHDVWIGQNALVKEGVVVGTGAVIGAGAVVTKNVKPYAIVGGVPARLIRYRFNESIIARLLQSKWWERSEDWLLKNWEKFNDVDEFLNYLQ